MENGTMLRIEVNAKNSADKDHLLSDAVAKLIPAALKQREGILVTRTSHAEFTIEVDPQVPCGFTREKTSAAMSQ
ncbi:hypothetical protein [Arthrobacter sp. Rue61a]|uniref:hypothetical protein n=1 Tax=Arthrobacter sp. Rue61a TaxID=1118963 RepID=UPI00027DF42C|nr:hypothetical protein [Arthrobacter sp. Rue61a]AFR31354.1 hypothetical protein ARUE_232p01460 [Arthrobacter sp. Rue61a]